MITSDFGGSAAPALRAGGLWLAGYVAHSLQTTAGMLVVRASPLSQIPSSNIGIYFARTLMMEEGGGKHQRLIDQCHEATALRNFRLL